MRTGGQVLADQLKIHDVDTVFCVPGESYLALIDALHDASNEIKVISCRQEGGATNMAEAFGKLTDEQRAVIYEELSRGAGTGERPLSSEPATLARAATRAEMRSPGSLERTLTAPRSGSSFAANVTSALLGTVAGYVIGSALVSAFLPWDAAYDSEASSGLDAAETDTDTDTGTDLGDFGGFDF